MPSSVSVPVSSARAFFLPTLLCILLAACGGETSVSLSPSAETLQIGESVTLVASARGTQIIWPASLPGTVVLNGNQAIYTPPATPGQYTFTITAKANRKKTATARIEVVPRPEITAFSLPGLPPAQIDPEAGTITVATQQWIDGLDALAAEFQATGPVDVGGITQTSGTTGNDFHQDVQYTVTTGQRFHRTYTVRLEAPQTTGLPVIRIDTEGNQEIASKEVYLQANIRITDPQDPANNIEHVNYADTVKGTWQLHLGLSEKTLPHQARQEDLAVRP
jgi:hypothetical protein